MEFAFVWFILAFIVGVAAGRRARSSGGWFLLALIVSPLLAGLLLLAMGRPEQVAEVIVGGERATPDTHVRCPDCRELVRRDARRCKHCGTGLVPQ